MKNQIRALIGNVNSLEVNGRHVHELHNILQILTLSLKSSEDSQIKASKAARTFLIKVLSEKYL